MSKSAKKVGSETAYNFIRKQILSGEFPPGYALTSYAISSQIGLSRTPIRDALRQLEADGLVEILPHVGASVKRLELQEYQEMCDLRLALESLAAGLAAERRTEADLQAIKAPLDAMRALTEGLQENASQEQMIAAVSELIKEDIRFHVAIITAARNVLLKKEILRFHLVSRIVSIQEPSIPDRDSAMHKLQLQHRREVLENHTAIFEAIEAQDRARATAEMQKHIQDIVDAAVRLVAAANVKEAPKGLTEEEELYR